MFEHIKINNQNTLADNMKELIASSKCASTLADVAAGEKNIYINYEPHGKWWLSIGVYCHPCLAVHTFNNEFEAFDPTADSLAEVKNGLMTDLEEVKNGLMTDLEENGYNFDPCLNTRTMLQGLLSQRIDKEIATGRVFYAEVPHTGGNGQVLEYYSSKEFKDAFINLAHNADDCSFEKFLSKADALSFYKDLDADEDDEDKAYNDVIAAIKALPDGGAVHVWHDGVSDYEVAVANDTNEFDWAWEVVTHDFRSADYIEFQET